MNRKSMIRKIRSLQSRTVEKGCTEAEALLAADTISRLLSVYQLSLTDVELGEERCEKVYLETGRKAAHEVQYCQCAIEFLTDTIIWKDYHKSLFRFAYFGLPMDTEFAVFLTMTIKTAMDIELMAYKIRCQELGEPTGRSASHSFLLGMANRVSKRLRDMKQDRQANGKSTGRDLVEVKNAIVKQQFKTAGIKLESSYGGTGARDKGALNAGKAAGDRVGLNRPIGGRTGGYMIGNS